jgi:hypothetical protein
MGFGSWEAGSKCRLLSWPPRCPAPPQAELTRKRLERAGKLTSGLAEEGVRWGQTVGQMDGQIERLVGDVFLGAACISYYGAFTGAYRCRAGAAGEHCALRCAALLMALPASHRSRDPCLAQRQAGRPVPAC